MIAALPMYDVPTTAAALDALRAGTRDRLRARGIAAPDALDRRAGLETVWSDPGLVLGQTCSLPFRTWLKDRVQVIGAFDMGLPDTDPGHYRSAIVTGSGCRAAALADLDGAVLAINQAHSHSGWAAIWIEMQAAGIAPARIVVTGAHRLSAEAVAEGQADFAALDMASLRLIARAAPGVVARLRTIGRTRASPGTPLIAPRGADGAALFAAASAAFDALPAAARAALGARAIVAVPEDAYLALPIPPAP